MSILYQIEELIFNLEIHSKLDIILLPPRRRFSTFTGDKT